MSAVAPKEMSTRRQSLLGDNPGDFAIVRHARVTPMKARRIGDLIRGKSVEEALLTLRFAPQAASQNLLKLVESAVANAVNNQGLIREDLVISQLFVDEGPTLKRFRPRAQGRASQILKRTSHITLVVTPREDKKGRAR